MKKLYVINHNKITEKLTIEELSYIECKNTLKLENGRYFHKDMLNKRYPTAGPAMYVLENSMEEALAFYHNFINNKQYKKGDKQKCK